MEADGSWWGPWSSKPVWGVKSLPGVFDSHTLPPSRGNSVLPGLSAGRLCHLSRHNGGGFLAVVGRKGLLMRGMRLLGVAALVAVCLAATGCTGLKERFMPSPTVVTVAPSVASVEATLTGEQLAEGRPTSLPLWPGSTVTTSSTTRAPTGISWNAEFVTDDDFDAVVKGFAVGLDKSGWTSEVTDASIDAERITLLAASAKNADAVFTFTRSTDSPETGISVVVTPR